MSRMSQWSWTLMLLAAAGCNTTDTMTGIPEEAKGTTAIPPIALAVEGAEASFRLYAGQDTPIGTVKVYNDATTMYLAIQLIDGWCMTASHVAAAATPAGIPHKNNNPLPGQFPYSNTYPGCDDEDSYEIPLAGLGLAPVIAVHAKVWNESSETTDYFYSTAGTERVYGPLSAYADLSGTWGAPKTAVAAWVHPSWPALPMATWISSAYATNGAPGTEDHAGDTWRRFQRTISVPGFPLSGEVTKVTSDNAEAAYVNGVLIGSDGEVQGPFVDNHEWNTLLTYPFMPVMGDNLLEFIVRNYAQAGGTAESNPTGLLYKASVTYYARNESAWAGRQMFLGKNWATYFTYAVTPFYTGFLDMNEGLNHTTLEFALYESAGGQYEYLNLTQSAFQYQGSPLCVVYVPGTPNTIRFSYKIPTMNIWVTWWVSGGASPTAYYEYTTDAANAATWITTTCVNGTTTGSGATTPTVNTFSNFNF